jgi:hypothetical protein
MVLKNFPLTYDIIKTASIPPEKRMSFDEILEYITFAGKEALDHFTAKTKFLLKLYFVFSFICFWIDFIYLMTSLSMRKDEIYTFTVYLFSSLVFVITDLYYFLWLISLDKRLPDFISKGFQKVLIGAFDSLYASIGKKLESHRQARERDYQESYNDHINNA